MKFLNEPESHKRTGSLKRTTGLKRTIYHERIMHLRWTGIVRFTGG